VAALAATASMMMVGGLGGSTPAHADPMFAKAYIGVGSDTIQDIGNAFSGAAPYPSSTAGLAVNFFTPLHSSVASGSKVIASWDAVDSTGAARCIVPKIGFPQIDGPNGSGQGVSALSRAVDGGAWFKTANCGGSATTTGNVTGAIDFARSSAGPASFKVAGTQLTMIPFARDGVSYAFFDHGTGNASSLTSAQLQALYGTGSVPSATGKITVGTDTVFACMVQGGSGTGKFWDKAMGNDGTGATAHTSAVNSGCNASQDYEENGANSFLTSPFISGLAAGQDAVIPFSAGSWIAQLNNAAQNRSSTGCTGGVGLGIIDTVNPRTTAGCGTGQAPNLTYYAGTTYGRDLYFVVPTTKVGVPGDAGIKSLFVGAGSQVCSATSTITTFGFGTNTQSGACGSTTQQIGLQPN